jgi:polyisoprenoid-binding protein YceI
MNKFLVLGVLAALAVACSQQKDAAQTPQTAAETPAASTSTDNGAATDQGTSQGTQPTAQEVPPPSTAPIPAGAYTLDKSHASLIFRVDHLGFSNYTARFKKFDAKLEFDPKNLGAAKVTATVDPNSLETDFPDPAKVDFNAQLRGEQWLDTAKYPEIKFESKRIEVTGDNTVRVHGDFTLHGVTKPVVLDAKFNGGYAGHPFDPNARIGFSAQGTLKRSEFGMGYGVPDPGSKFGVGDDVSIHIEAEFTGPPLAGAQKQS